MLQRFCSGSEALHFASRIQLSPLVHQTRLWVKPKKRPKVGQGFHEKAQRWREEFLLDRHRVVADSIKAYVEHGSSTRTAPWDARFKPFDRSEKDGVYVIMKHLMDDKLQLVGQHPRATKRLLCNVGLMGPTISTAARWKPHRITQLSAGTTKADRLYTRDRSIANHGYSDL